MCDRQKIGVKIRIAGVISMNMPTTIRITFIRKKITYLLVEMDIIPLEIAAGILSMPLQRTWQRRQRSETG